MPQFSDRSLAQLETIHPSLRAVLEEAIRFVDFTVLEGHRNQADQDRAFEMGRSKVRWPNGKHNSYPSMAVDLAPYPISWSTSHKNLARFYYLGGVLKGIAGMKGVKLRFGFDWDSDNDFSDQNFDDLGHVEIIEAKTMVNPNV